MTGAVGDIQVLLVGGWAQPEAALLPLQQNLCKLGPVNTLVLDEPEAILLAQLNDIMRQFQGKTLAVGWSLGGQLLLRAMTQDSNPQSFRELRNKLVGLACIACNPFFIGDDGWPGVGDDFFGQFEAGLKTDATRLLQKFFKLQLVGDPQFRARLRALTPALTQVTEWSSRQLGLSLSWLRHWDTRKLLSELNEVIFFLGQQDRLIPPELFDLLVNEYPRQQTIQLSDMAHYPHGDAAAEMVQTIQKRWLI